MTDRLILAVQELVQAIRAEVIRPADVDRLLSVEQAAELLGIGRSMAFDLIRDGRLRSVTAGRRRLVPSSAVTEFAARSAGR